jgi:myosin heavy subunit
MSGEKRTPIEILQDELRAVRNQVFNINKQRKQLLRDLANVRKENSGQISQLEKRMAKRDQTYQKAIDGLQSNMKSMAQEHHQAMQAQRLEFIDRQKQQKNELLKELADSEERTNEKIENLQNWTAEHLNKQRSEYLEIADKQQKQLNTLRQEITTLNKKEANRQEYAASYLEDLSSMIKVADENLPHKKYAPGKLDKITRQLDAARSNVLNDIPTAAIPMIQQAHFDLMDMEKEILQKEAEFELIYEMTLENAKALLENVQKNRKISLEEDEDGIEHETNYWTNGKFDTLKTGIQEIKENLEANKESLSIEEVNSLLGQLSENIKKQETIINEAVERIISSQYRAEMGDVVVESLEKQGFIMRPDETGYTERDQRKPYLIKLENRAGTKVVAVIAPDEATNKNTISLNTFDNAIHDEAAEELRNEEIRDALAKGGLELGDTICNPSNVEAFKDVKSILEKGGKGIPRKTLEQVGILNSQTTSKSR